MQVTNSRCVSFLLTSRALLSHTAVQGTLFFSYYGGEKISYAINEVGYDAFTLGNVRSSKHTRDAYH